MVILAVLGQVAFSQHNQCFPFHEQINFFFKIFTS
jgi:hypothetical protein